MIEHGIKIFLQNFVCTSSVRQVMFDMRIGQVWSIVIPDGMNFGGESAHLEASSGGFSRLQVNISLTLGITCDAQGNEPPDTAWCNTDPIHSSE